MMRALDLAEEQGIPTELVQAYRSPEEQQGLYQDKSRPVTNAPALLSFHNHGLAGDLVPKAYISMPQWNPSGPLWQKLGLIGESVGLSWGGRWGKPDLPHFEAKWAPIQELKAYWEKYKSIMPITLTPTTTALIMMVLIGGVWYFMVRPTMQKSGLV